MESSWSPSGCSIAISCLFMSADGVQTKALAGRGETSTILLFLFLKKVRRLELGIFKTQRQKTRSASTTRSSSLWAPVRFVRTFSAICPPKARLLAVDTAKYSFKGLARLILADLGIVDWTFVFLFPCVNLKTGTEFNNCTFGGNIAKEMHEQTLSWGQHI